MAAPHRLDDQPGPDSHQTAGKSSETVLTSAPDPCDFTAAARTPANVNALVWGLGNGLVSSTLIVYLVQALGASGLGVALILAAPQLIGLGRLGAAKFARGGKSRKRFCIGNYFASGLVLAVLPALPILAIYYKRLAPGEALGGVIVIWCLYHLLEYLATVALWSWLRDLVPLAHRGLFIGRREGWLNAGRVIGMLAGGLYAWQYTPTSPDMKWAAYVGPAACGAVFLMLAVVPLFWMPIGSANPQGQDRDAGPGPISGFRWRQLLTPLLDQRLSRLMIYGCWFSFFNGLTQSAQGILTVRVLDVPLIWMLALRTGMTFGQTLVSPLLGRWADRFGNRPVLMVAQVIVGLGLWGYLKATPDQPWLIGIAWFAWIAYAGINIGVPNLLLKLSPPGQAGACVASYFALTGICYGVSTIIGGIAFDFLRGQTIFVQNTALDRYQFLFFFGIVTRVTGIVFLLAIDEPKPVMAAEVSNSPEVGAPG